MRIKTTAVLIAALFVLFAGCKTAKTELAAKELEGTVTGIYFVVRAWRRSRLNIIKPNMAQTV